MNTSDKNTDTYLLGLDISAGSVFGMVGYCDKSRFIVKDSESEDYASSFVSECDLNDTDKVSEAVKRIKQSLEDRCAQEFNEVFLSVPSAFLKTMDVHASLLFEEVTIIKDVHIYSLYQKSIKDACDRLNSRTDSHRKYYCLSKDMVKYSLDDELTDDLVLKKGSKIGIEMVCTFLSYDAVEALESIASNAGLKAKLTLSPCADAYILLNDEFKDKNTAVLNINGEGSDLSIITDGMLVSCTEINDLAGSLADSLAEYILVEPDEAEKIIKRIETSKETEFEDILGLNHTITKKDVYEKLLTPLKNLSRCAYEEIIRLNAIKKIDAIIVTGELSKFCEHAAFLKNDTDIPVSFFDLKSEDILNKVSVLEDSRKLNYVTVKTAGAVLNSLTGINSFINVSINDDVIKLYDNNRLTVLDAAMQIGLDKNALFARLGDSLTFILNGKEQTVKGEPGENCTLILNGEECALNSYLHDNDSIKLIPSTKGIKGSITLGGLNKVSPKLSFTVNNMNVSLPVVCSVNGKMYNNSYEIKDGDQVEIPDYLTVDRILELLDITLKDNQKVTVNGETSHINTKVYSNSSVDVINI